MEAACGPDQADRLAACSEAHEAVRAAQARLQSLGARGTGLMITPSRRTPEGVTALIDEVTRGLPRILWDGTGPNPYPHFLAHADAFIAPADSVNMTGEACATGILGLIAFGDASTDAAKKAAEAAAPKK